MDKATVHGRERANAALSALALAENAVHVQDVCAYMTHLESLVEAANRRAAQFEHSYLSVKTVSDKTMEAFTTATKYLPKDVFNKDPWVFDLEMFKKAPT